MTHVTYNTLVTELFQNWLGKNKETKKQKTKKCDCLVHRVSSYRLLASLTLHAYTYSSTPKLILKYTAQCTFFAVKLPF